MDVALAVRARGITKCFGDVVALEGIELDVAPGRIHGVVGPWKKPYPGDSKIYAPSQVPGAYIPALDTSGQ